MAEIDLMHKYPKSKRNVEERGSIITPEDRAIARQFGESFFDGDRKYGYGGFGYHERFWTETVKVFRDHYDLAPDAAVLDVGCAKGFMMHDFKLLMPEMDIQGLDISDYAIENAIEDMKPYVRAGSAVELPWPDNSFDLVISINTVHNLDHRDCVQSLKEIERVSRKDAFITVDAWRNEAEEKAMKSWNLTALTYMHVDDWPVLFEEAGYTGDYYWFIP